MTIFYNWRKSTKKNEKRRFLLYGKRIKTLFLPDFLTKQPQ